MNIRESVPVTQALHMPMSGLREYLFSTFRMNKLLENKSIINVNLIYQVETKDFKAFALTLSGLVSEDVNQHVENSVFKSHDGKILMEYTPDEHLMEVTLLGEPETVAAYERMLEDKFTSPTAYIKCLILTPCSPRKFPWTRSINRSMPCTLGLTGKGWKTTTTDTWPLTPVSFC